MTTNTSEEKLEIEKATSEKQLHTNPLLGCVAEKGESELKDFLIDFTGERLNPEDESVTVNMIAEVLAAEFPEFMFAFAEENFLRGYQLGLDDAYKTFARTPSETAASAD